MSQTRRSGVVVPLFSLASSRSWGLGEFGDLPPLARWLMEAGQSIVQILPILEMPPIESSPYSAMTAMALDPIYITMANNPDFAGLGAELALDGAEQAEVKRLRQTRRIEYASIRRLKDKWLSR
jgi:4-alpha-glucanotransferase